MKAGRLPFFREHRVSRYRRFSFMSSSSVSRYRRFSFMSSSQKPNAPETELT
jgi:hypothetical protein